MNILSTPVVGAARPAVTSRIATPATPAAPPAAPPAPAAPAPPAAPVDRTQSFWQKIDGGPVAWKAVAGGVGIAALALAAEVGLAIAGMPSVGGGLLAGAAAVAGAAGGYLLADAVATGYHWLYDNYDLGEMSRIFQEHHHTPAQITKWGVAEVNFKAGLAALPLMAAAAVFCPAVLGSGIAAAGVGAFALSFGGLSYLANGIHRWSHMKREDLSLPVRKLQDWGVFLTRQNHVNGHHKRPWEEYYGIINGTFDDWMRRVGFWRRLEKTVYNVTGAVPHSWERQAVKDAAFKLPDTGTLARIERNVYRVLGRTIPEGALPPPCPPPARPPQP